MTGTEYKTLLESYDPEVKVIFQQVLSSYVVTAGVGGSYVPNIVIPYVSSTGLAATGELASWDVNADGPVLYIGDNDSAWKSAFDQNFVDQLNGTTNLSFYIINGGNIPAARDVDGGSSADDEQTPAAEFNKHKEEIKKVVKSNAADSLRRNVAASRQQLRDARNRFVAARDQQQVCGDDIQDRSLCTDQVTSRNFVPFDVNGGFSASGGRLSTQGTFFGQVANSAGTYRRLVFGDFDVTHNSDTGSTTATLSGKVAWEYTVAADMMLGYYLGGEIARSDLDGVFDGEQDRYGVQIGSYFVKELGDNLFADGFVSLGVGQNDLELSNGVLELDSDYKTTTASMGAALTGVIEQDGFEIWPELAFTYGKTWIGNIGFTGRAYGLVDNTLSLDAGNVTIANVTIRPEVRIPLDGLPSAQSRSVFSFAPRLLCEKVKTDITREDCGGGAEIGFVGASKDGLSRVNAKILADRIGGSTQSALQLNLTHQF